MIKRKLWIPLLAAVLAFVSLAGLVAALIPAESLIDPDECLHEYAKPIKEDVHDEHNGTFLYYCSDCDSRFERTMIEDCFANNIPEINGSQINYLGNWTVGDYYGDTYTVYDAVHIDVVDYQLKWLVLSSAVALWRGTGGFNPYCAASSNEHRVGVAENGHDCAIVWTTPRDGIVVLGSSDFEIEVDSSAYNVSVLHNGKQIAPASGYINIAKATVGNGAALNEALSSVRVAVKAGDQIAFRCSRIDVGANKSIMPSVTYVDHIPHLR